MLKIDGVTHWSIPVNDLEEGERFYRDLLEVRDPTWKAGMAMP
jgi:catechol 2,3-dioxygenase-like lactoylglutathione lyase family enzyme